MSTIDRDDVMEVNEGIDLDIKEDSGADQPPDTLRILESLLFASDELLTAARIKAILPGNPDVRHIRKLVDKINVQLQNERHPFEIVEIGGGYQFRTVAYFHPWVRQIFKEKAAKKLSLQALECLAVIAYKQPVSKAEIEAVRGVVSDGAMKTLLEKKLVTISGRSEKPGRPLQYSTTHEFLRYFGLNKIEDLPRIEEFEAIAREKIEDLSFEELTSGDAGSNEELTEQQQLTSEMNIEAETESSDNEDMIKGVQLKSVEVEGAIDEVQEAVVEINEDITKIENTVPETEDEIVVIKDTATGTGDESSKIRPPEPTAVFEVDYSAFSKKDPQITDSVESKKNEAHFNNISSVQDMDEIETTEISVEQRECIKQQILSEKNPHSSSPFDSKTKDKKTEEAVSSNSQQFGDADMLEVYLPEKTVDLIDNDLVQKEKKGFFSKIRKKKTEESDQ